MNIKEMLADHETAFVTGMVIIIALITCGVVFTILSLGESKVITNNITNNYNNTVIEPLKETIMPSTIISGDANYKEGLKIYCDQWNDNLGKMMCKGSDEEWHCYERDGDRYTRNFTTIELPWDECRE